MKYVALYNPKADNGKGRENAEVLSVAFHPDEFTFQDVTQIVDFNEFFKNTPQDVGVVICGGDGTLNRFANDTYSIAIKNGLYYYPCGSGNDFARDLGLSQQLIPLNDYLKNLPSVYIKGQKSLFINGIGYGIDGYCCEKADEIRKKNAAKKINYTSLAIKGLLFGFKPVNATITVDGKKRSYKKVWLAPTMHGRFYGGGMMPAPNQVRNNPVGTVSVMLFHGSGKLKTLCIFPSIFSGKHVKKVKNVSVFTGNDITVEFDRPCALQIDGETVLNVTKYQVKSAALAEEVNKNAV